MPETVVEVPITLSCCPHILDWFDWKVGSERELAINLSDGVWVFKRAKLELVDGPCECISGAKNGNG